jgi:hypothetical protein
MVGSEGLTGADEESSLDRDVSRHESCDVISSAADSLAMELLWELLWGEKIIRNGVFEYSRENSRIYECQRNEGACCTITGGISLPFHQLI